MAKQRLQYVFNYSPSISVYSYCIARYTPSQETYIIILNVHDHMMTCMHYEDVRAYTLSIQICFPNSIDYADEVFEE